MKLDARWPRALLATNIAGDAGMAVVGSTMDGVEAARDPGVTALRCRIVERRNFAAVHKNGKTGGSEKPERGDEDLVWDEGEANCRVRSRGGSR